MELIFASGNHGKAQEIRATLPDSVTLLTLKDIGITEALPEPFDTFEENAWSKAKYVVDKTGQSCFAEDSGLVVPALDGAPGVFSARYAGLPTNDENNNRKLLRALQNVTDRNAYYQTVICLIRNGETRYFKGRCCGSVRYSERGAGGFGYDPLFVPDGYDRTFAELPLTEKNKISHRGKAMKQFLAFLTTVAA